MKIVHIKFSLDNFLLIRLKLSAQRINLLELLPEELLALDLEDIVVALVFISVE
jgi:hypothetical protein